MKKAQSPDLFLGGRPRRALHIGGAYSQRRSARVKEARERRPRDGANAAEGLCACVRVGDEKMEETRQADEELVGSRKVNG